MQSAIKDRIESLLKRCPRSGTGVHNWVYYAACEAIEAGLSDEEAIPMIEGLMSRAPSPANEIESALSSARCGAGSSAGPRWPNVDQDRLASIFKDAPKLADLHRYSPMNCEFGRARTEQYVDQLFAGNPLLCVGVSEHSFATKHREAWRGCLALRQFIVPSPMTKAIGLTKVGKPSAHCLDNTGPRRYLVVEFDAGTLDQHAAVIYHLAKLRPLVMIVFSGSKSLHAWFPTWGQPHDDLLNFFRYAVSLGADKATWNRTQFVRLPDGRRGDGKSSDALRTCGFPSAVDRRQAVLFFNPEVIQ